MKTATDGCAALEGIGKYFCSSTNNEFIEFVASRI
jgi:hypothetical protein